MSSASYPSSRSWVIWRASRTSSIKGSWLRKWSGAFSRCDLYSGYDSDRKVFRETSQATAMPSGS